MISWLKAERDAWRQAWRELPENPLRHYLVVTAGRQRKKLPVWRRWLLPLLVFSAVMYGVVFGVVDVTHDYLAGYILPMDLISNYLTLALLGFAGAWGALLIPALFDTAMAVMGFLSLPAARRRGLMIDDMSAISGLTDYDITCAVIQVYWPRLIRFSFWGAVLLAAYLVDLDNLWYEILVEDTIPLTLIFAPVTIGFMTVSGAIGGLLCILWLLAMGNGQRQLLFASMTGAVLTGGYLIYIPIAVAFASEALRNSDFGNPELMNGPANVLFGLASAILILLGYFGLCWLAERWRPLRSFLGPGAPVVFFIGLAMHFVIFAILDVYLSESTANDLTATLALGYLTAWSSTLVFNPLAVPIPQCYGWEWGEWWVLLLEWFRYPLLIIQQLVMVVIGLTFARRAVNLRRCNGG